MALQSEGNNTSNGTSDQDSDSVGGSTTGTDVIRRDAWGDILSGASGSAGLSGSWGAVDDGQGVGV